MEKKNWDEIKTEYISGGISQRQLAEEHEVSYKTLRDRAKKEGWVELRRKAGEKTAQKLVDSISDAKIKKIEKIVDQLLTQTLLAARQNTKRPIQIRTTEQLEDGSVRVTVKTQYEDVKIIDKAGLRLLAQTAKDLDEILRKQRMEAQGRDVAQTINVIFDARDEELDG